MKPSTYQQKIIEWVKNGTGHGCCNAVAGSGKSTTLKLTAKALTEAGYNISEIKICVFGKANSVDLINKLGSAWKSSISTLHSAGWTLVKKELDIKNSYDVKITDQKYKFIAQDLYYLHNKKERTSGSLFDSKAIKSESSFIQLVNLVRLCLLEPNESNISWLVNHFEIEEIYDFKTVATAIAHCLRVGEAEASRKVRFDYTDQIWLPIKWQLNHELWFKPYKFVLVDECQDLNASQLELVTMLAGKSGRILAVGDPRQAIMGFAGADNKSYQKIVKQLNATELPLSVCYRCPKSHINLVKHNFPEIPIEANSTAAVGKIELIKEADLWGTEFDGFTQVPKNCNLQEDDLVISRKTAPLVTLCIKLISKGIPATVKGKSIGEQLKVELQEISKIPGFFYENFNEALKDYQIIKQQRYKGLDNEEQLIETLKDKLEALSTIYKSQPQARSIQDLGDYIDALFSDNHSPITLSTCHRAKGLEGDRIFIIKPEDMPMTWRDQHDWQLEQEENLLYVALTRSKSELFIVGNPDWFPVEEKPTVTDLQSEEEDNPPVFNNHPLFYAALESTWGDPEDLDHTEDFIEESNPVNGLQYAEKIEQSATANHLQLPSDRVRAILLNPDWQNKSDRAIAEACQTSAPTVAKVRRRMLEAGEIEKSQKRTTKNGKVMDTAAIGTKPRSAKEKLAEIIEGLSKEEILELILFLREQL